MSVLLLEYQRGKLQCENTFDTRPVQCKNPRTVRGKEKCDAAKCGASDVGKWRPESSP